MPERIVRNLAERWNDITLTMWFWGLGASIGVGQHLLSRDPFSLRVVIGRALSTGGLAVIAGLIVVPHPDAPLLAQLGLAALIASLGVNGVEAVFRRYLRRA